MPGEITVVNAKGTHSELLQLEPSEARKTLGVYLAMDGNFKEQVTYLRKKMSEFGDHIQKGKLNRFDSWYALKSTIWKMLKYPLEAITHMKRQQDYILSLYNHRIDDKVR